MTAPVGDDLTWLDDLERALLRAILGDTDGGLVLDGDLPAAEIARLIREEAAPAANAVLIAELRKYHAAVPDPRFRDQLDEDLALAYSGRTREAFDAAPAEWRQAWFDDTEALIPVVEARVQAAANQRAAEEPVAAESDFSAVACSCDSDLVPPHPAHLPWPTPTSPAPVPPDANGGEER